MSYPVQRPKWERSLGAYSPEDIGQILRDPPKSIHTYAKNKVEFGDVAHEYRQNPDLISDHIRVYARGVNPAVSVSYANADSGTSGRNIYPVNKDGAFRPPLIPMESDMPLSRMPHENTAINPSITLPSTVIQSNTDRYIDKNLIKPAIQFSHNTPVFLLPSIPTTTPIRPQGPQHTVVRPSISVASGFGNVLPTITISGPGGVERHIKDQPVINYLTPAFNLAVKTPNGYDLLNLPIKEKINIASRIDVNAPLQITASNGQHLPIKDYIWSVVKTAPNMPTTLVIEHVDPYKIRTKNPTTASVMTSLETNITRNPDVLAPMLDRNRPTYSLRSNVAPPIMIDNVSRDIRLPDTLKMDSFENRGEIPQFERPEFHPVGIDHHRNNMRRKMQAFM